MPSKSAKQHRLMQAVKHNRKFAKKVGIPQGVGREFVAADQRQGRYAKGGKIRGIRGILGRLTKENPGQIYEMSFYRPLPNGDEDEISYYVRATDQDHARRLLQERHPEIEDEKLDYDGFNLSAVKLDDPQFYRETISEALDRYFDSMGIGEMAPTGLEQKFLAEPVKQARGGGVLGALVGRATARAADPRAAPPVRQPSFPDRIRAADRELAGIAPRLRALRR